MSAIQGTRLDIARFMVALAPNRSDLRDQLDRALQAEAGALRADNKPLELQQPPRQMSIAEAYEDDDLVQWENNRREPQA